jgi:uncharacterized delta-60 repeat protein
MLLFPVRAVAEIVPDTGFGVNGVVRTAFGSGNADTPHDLLIQPDGRILTAGVSKTGQDFFIAMTRHSDSGVLDSTTFGSAGTVLTHFALRDQANGIALDESGRIVVAGMHAVSNAVSQQVASVYRFQSDGTIDSTFADSGYVSSRYDPVSSAEHFGATVRPDGKVVAAGRCNANINGGTNGFGFKRYIDDGTGDVSTRFDFGIAPSRGSCAFLEDGRILWATWASLNGRIEFVMARTDTLGDRDTTFAPGGIRQTGIEATPPTVFSYMALRVLVLPDGKILLAGSTPKGGGRHQLSAFRFHADGGLDSTFGVNGRTDVVFTDGTSDLCFDAAVDESGRILLAGLASTLGFSKVALARLLPDGGPDSTFSGDGKLVSNLNGSSGTHYMTRVLALPNGKILGAGFDFASNGGDFFLVRYMDEATSIESPATNPNPTLVQAFPNPTRGETTFRFRLDHEDIVSVEVFDITGRRVRRLFDGPLAPGAHTLLWDGRDGEGREIAPGVFFSRIANSAGVRTDKLIRVR